ncbi:CcdB family protein [Magnetospirillum sp. UT-4]|uniref:CcdB family protein n=1 Tax=Magnetospirillum sp. UT-4 TaxID=2681467 RepID=UPI00137C5807|nr:CcdB family protein [Magnetospirillum sp. UT-4]CAA7616269.1 putative CcdB-like protein [Magnetospirillum sp. UT-4]
MRQFDVYRPRSGPHLLILQDDSINHFNAVVAAPLYPADDWERPMRHLQPIFDLDGQSYVLVTNLLAAIPRAHFTDCVHSLESHRDEIIAALDFLFTGI